MRRCIAALACVLAGTFGVFVLPAAGARAETTVSLPITSFRQIVVDSVHDHLFISQGSGTAGSILVTDFSGAVVAMIPGQDGVQGMALSPDGATLYAALASDGAVSAISTSTLQEITSYPLGDPSYVPVSVAVQSGQVWVSYNTGAPGQAAIGAIDPAAADPVFVPQATAGPSWGGAPLLASDPGDSGVLVAVGPGQPATGVSFDTTTVPAPVLAQAATLGGAGASCENPNDLAVVPGGAEVITACDAPYEQVRYSTATLTPIGAYLTNPYPDAIAIAAGTGTVAAGIGILEPRIYVFAPDGATPLNVFEPGADFVLAPRGLAQSADGSELFAVIQDTTTSAYSLAVFDDPAKTQSTLALSGPSSAIADDTLTLNGTLTLSGGVALPAGATVNVTRTAPDNTVTALPPAQPGPGGGFTVTDDPAEVGTYTYTASYAGDTGIARATGSFTVTVALNTSALTLNGPPSAIVDAGLTIKGILALGNGAAPPPGTTVTVARTDPGNVTTPLPPAPLAPGGGFTVTDRPAKAGTYTYTVSYSGDVNTTPSQATIKVTEALNRAALKIGGPAVVTFGRNVAITGRLSLSAGTPRAGTPVTVVRTESGSKATKRFALRTRAAGGFALTDPAPAKGHYTYTASYGGDAATTSARVALAVTVARTTPSMALTTSAADYVYGTRITVRATLGATFADRTVSIYARPAGQGWKLLKTGRVSAAGVLTAGYQVTRSTAFRAVFAGDVHNAPAAVSREVGAWVKVSMSNSGYFKSTTINGVVYRVYHHTGHLNAAVAVTPDKHGQCIDLEVQQYDTGGRVWFANQTFGCFGLNGSSTVSTYLTLLGASGFEFRMRADYVHSATDTANLSTDGAWFYFEVVK